MVGRLQLVFDDDPLAGTHVSADQIQGKPADLVLGLGELQVHAEDVSEYVGVGQQPTGEVVGFVLPHDARVDRQQPVQQWVGYGVG
jgi:hypothetical protein